MTTVQESEAKGNGDKIGEVINQAPATQPDISTVQNTTTLQDTVGTAVDETLKEPERVDLGIDWDSLDKPALFASMANFDNAENIYPKIQAGKHDGYVLHETKLITNTGEALVIQFTKIISPNFHELQINIVRPSLPEDNSGFYVADFDFLQRKQDQGEEWDMKHRKTGRAYRKQGIAEKLLDLTGEILLERSMLNSLRQSITCTAIQSDLIKWLRKRNFEPATDQDAKNLRRVEEGDRSLLEISKNGETYIVDLNEIRALFGGTLPDLNDPRIWEWDESNPDNPFYHMNIWQQLKFTIKLKKTI